MSVRRRRTPPSCSTPTRWCGCSPPPTRCSSTTPSPSYAVALVQATRDPAAQGVPEVAGALAFGACPRATLGLVAAGRALALLRGRDYVVPEDVRDVARDVDRRTGWCSPTTRSPTGSPPRR